MSLIHEALKRVESEKSRRKAHPGVTSPPPPRPQRPPSLSLPQATSLSTGVAMWAPLAM